MISGIEHSLGATESELWSEEFSSFPGDMTETRHIQRQSPLCFVAKSPADTDEMTESRRAAKRAETSDEERVCTCLRACWHGWCGFHVNGMTKFIFWQKQFVKSTEAVSEGFQKRWIIEPTGGLSLCSTIRLSEIDRDGRMSKLTSWRGCWIEMNWLDAVQLYGQRMILFLALRCSIFPDRRPPLMSNSRLSACVVFPFLRWKVWSKTVRNGHDTMISPS